MNLIKNKKFPLSEIILLFLYFHKSPIFSKNRIIGEIFLTCNKIFQNKIIQDISIEWKQDLLSSEEIELILDDMIIGRKILASKLTSQSETSVEISVQGKRYVEDCLKNEIEKLIPNLKNKITSFEQKPLSDLMSDLEEYTYSSKNLIKYEEKHVPNTVLKTKQFKNKLVVAINNLRHKKIDYSNFFEKYYVARTSSSRTNEVVSLLEFTTKPQHILFSGQAGCGKTTELQHIKYLLESRKKGNFTVIFISSILNGLHTKKMMYTDLLIGIFSELLIQLPDNVNLTKETMSELSTLLVELDDEHVTKLTHNDIKSISTGFFSLFLLKFSKSQQVRDEFRKLTEIKIRKILSLFDSVLNDIRNVNGNSDQIIIIVDDLEKIVDDDVIVDFLYNHGKLILDRECSFIMTVNDSIHFDLKGQNALYPFYSVSLPFISIKTPDGSYNFDEINRMKEIMLKRIPKAIIDDKALELAIIYSGGNLSVLFKIYIMAINKVNFSNERKVKLDFVREAFYDTRFKDDALDFDRLQKLRLIHHSRGNYKQELSRDELKEFIHTSILLTYYDPEKYDKQWFVLNPVLYDEQELRKIENRYPHELIMNKSLSRTRPFKILELVSMIKTTQQGIIICSYDNIKTLDFFQKGLEIAIRENGNDIFIHEKGKNDDISFLDLISHNSNYNKSEKKLEVISKAYSDNDLPSFELLNQACSFYTKINHPLIFWFYKPCVQWLYRLAPNFMGTHVGFFEFDHEETISNSKFLGLEFPKFTRDEQKIEFYKKQIVRSYSAKNLQDARSFLEHLPKILNLELNIKDLVTFAIEMIKTGNENILLSINEMVRRQMQGKEQNRFQEDKKFSEYCKQVAEECEKIGKYDMAKIYTELGTNIDTNLDQLFRTKKDNDELEKNY